MATAVKKPTKERETRYGRVDPDYRLGYTMIKYVDYVEMLRAERAAREDRDEQL